jgi:hypothetical protein
MSFPPGSPRLEAPRLRALDAAAREADAAKRRAEQEARKERLKSSGVLELSVARLLDELMR